MCKPPGPCSNHTDNPFDQSNDSTDDLSHDHCEDQSHDSSNDQSHDESTMLANQSFTDPSKRDRSPSPQLHSHLSPYKRRLCTRKRIKYDLDPTAFVDDILDADSD